MQLENLQERAFYIQQAANEQWTVRFMQRMIRTRYYYQVGLGEMQLVPTNDSTSAAMPVKRLASAPTLSAVGGTARTRLANIKKMLLEQYVGYAFVAQRQYVSVAGQDRWVELVFFHFVLNRFVLVQLGETDPATVAQFRMLLDGYIARQPPTVDKQPIGLLVNQNGGVKIQTSSQETVLPLDDQSALPVQFS